MNVWKKSSARMMPLLILMTLGLACAEKHPVTCHDFILDPTPSPMPEIMDESPQPCPECTPINGQTMWKITERDFKAVKNKLMEQKAYSSYLSDLLVCPSK